MSRIKKWVAGSAIACAFKPREAKPTELFPGVEKPTVTLCYMLVAEMLQNLDVKVVSKAGERDRYYGYVWTQHTYTFPKFTLCVSTHSGEQPNKYVVTIGGNVLAMTSVERNIIKEGWIKFQSLRNEMRKAKEESDRQDSAVTMIANFFKTEDTKDVHQVRAGDGHAT